MKHFDFRNIIENSKLWIKKQYIRDKQGLNSNCINIIKGLYNSNTAFETIAENNVWKQSFIISATGEDLNKLGEDLGVYREGLGDEEYRDKIIGYHKITIEGSTLTILKEYIESLGYSVTNAFRIYPDGYNPEIGGNGNGDTGDLIMTISESAFRNFTTFIEVSETLTESEINRIEKKIKPYHKVNNFVYVRSNI